MAKLTFNSIMIGTHDPKELAAFYAKVLDRKADWEDSKYYVWQFGTGSFSIGEHSEVHGEAKEPARIMMNFETTDVKEEAARIKEVGAKVIAEPYTMGEGDKAGWIATFADSDGNYFQLMTPWKDED